MAKLIEKEISERKNTNSCAGYFCKLEMGAVSGCPSIFTIKFTQKNEIPERMMYRMLLPMQQIYNLNVILTLYLRSLAKHEKGPFYFKSVFRTGFLRATQR